MVRKNQKILGIYWEYLTSIYQYVQKKTIGILRFSAALSRREEGAKLPSLGQRTTELVPGVEPESSHKLDDGPIKASIYMGQNPPFLGETAQGEKIHL